MTHRYYFSMTFHIFDESVDNNEPIISITKIFHKLYL